MEWVEILNNLSLYQENLERVKINRRYYRTKKIFKPSVIVTFSFGNSLNKNSYNWRLAEISRDASSLTGCKKLIFEKEVYNLVVKKFKRKNLEVSPFGFVVSDAVLISSMNTREGLLLVQKIIKKKKLDKKKILFIAHPAHIFRVIETAKKLGMSGYAFVEDKGFYPKTDGQFFARWKTTFILREIFVRIHHKILGWV